MPNLKYTPLSELTEKQAGAFTNLAKFVANSFKNVAKGTYNTAKRPFVFAKKYPVLTTTGGVLGYSYLNQPYADDGEDDYDYSRGGAPRMMGPTVNLVDPSMQFTRGSNAYGMSGYVPVTRNYMNVLQDNYQAMQRNKMGSEMDQQPTGPSALDQAKDFGGQVVEHLPEDVQGRLPEAQSAFTKWLLETIPYQNATHNLSAQPNSMVNPAQLALRQGRGNLGYDRKRHGFLFQQLMTRPRREIAERQNMAVARDEWQNNRAQARKAHAIMVDNWFASGQRGAPPRYMSAERLLANNRARMNKQGSSKIAALRKLAGGERYKLGYSFGPSMAPPVNTEERAAEDAKRRELAQLYWQFFKQNARDAGGYLGNKFQDFTTYLRRHGEDLYADTSAYLNPDGGDLESQAIANAQSAQRLQSQLRALNMQRDYMRARLGSQATPQNMMAIDRDIRRAQQDIRRYTEADKRLSAAAMRRHRNDPAAKMQMMDRRNDMLGAKANDHLAVGANPAPLAQQPTQSRNPASGNRFSQQGAGGRPTQTPRYYGGITPRQHVRDIRANL